MKPSFFIASSKESIDIAYACQQNLWHDAEVTVWEQGIIKISTSTLESLTKQLNSFDFGMFVFSPDDIIEIRGEKDQAVRDNVLFELGLFIGKLGKDRCYILIPEGDDSLRTPTDLLGISAATYETNRIDGNLRAATGPACTEIREAMKQTGARFIEPADPNAGRQLAETIDDSRTIQSDKAISNQSTETEAVIEEQENWVSPFMKDDYPKAENLLETEIASLEKIADNMTDLAFLESYKALCKYRIAPNIGWQVFHEVISKYPTQVNPYITFSREQFNNNLPEESLDTLESGISKVGKNYILINHKAKRLIDIGRDEDAISVLNEGISKYPNEPGLYETLASYYIDSEEYALARSHLEDGLSKIPDNKSLLSLYAQLLYKHIDIKLSLIPYNRLVVLFPEDPKFLTLRANVYLDLELYDLAMCGYKKANELVKEEQAWILANIGNLYKNRGFYRDSIEYLKLALEIDPESEYSHDRLATSIKYRDEQVRKLSSILREARRDISKPPTAEDSNS